MKQRGFRYCSVCKHKLQKRSKTAAGKQRWQCVVCQRSCIRPRQDLQRGFVLEAFVAWLLGNHSQVELRQSARTFRSQTVWCWQVAVPQLHTGEVNRVVIVDGIKVGSWVCLIARTTQYVISWQWVPYESSQYWIMLFNTVPPPEYIVCDGQKGLLKAIAICWPTTIVQRCRFHTWLNLKAKLTLNPTTKASRELLKLTRDLMHVQTRQQARRWKRRLKSWYRKNQQFINQRTIKPDPKPRERRWRYTHERLRSAYRQLYKISDDLLCSSYHPDPNLPSTTNHVEGGLNSQIRTKLKAHRGMPIEHQIRLVDWYLYSRTEEPKPPRFCL